MSKSHRIFTAIPVDQPYVAGLVSAFEGLTFEGMRLVSPSQIHCTIHFFASLTEEQVTELSTIYDVVFGAIPRGTITYGTYGVFPEERRPAVLWRSVDVGIDQVVTAKEAADKALGQKGFIIEKRRFVPHITLARFDSRRSARGQNVGQLLNSLNSRSGSLTIPLDRIDIIKSELSSNGPRYTTVHSVALHM